MIASVAAGRRIDQVFHRLDVVRWERERIEISDVESESDLFDRAVESLDGLLASDPDPEGLLAVRLVLAGTTGLHDRLLADPERVSAEIRSLATDRGPDRLWIEKVELHTQPRRALTTPDGPSEELLEVLEQFRAEPGAFQEVVEELAELKRKLPPDLSQDRDTPRLDDPEWLQTLLEQVQPMLLGLLHKSGDGADRRLALIQPAASFHEDTQS